MIDRIYLGFKETAIDKSLFFFTKRVFDVVVGIVGTIVLIPLMIIVKLISVLNGDTDSIWFVQKRIGKNGREFDLIKFRTMVMGADQLLEKLLREDKELAYEYKVYKKLDNDPRVTKIGGFLRKTSLDECPQFLNILTGSMSFIGNRPYLPRERKDMGNDYKIIVRTKPGLTGLWQVSGRSNVSFKHRLEIEKKYSENIGFKQDLEIFIKTFKVVIKSMGAK